MSPVNSRTDALVPCYTFSSSSEAYIAKGLLDSNGIKGIVSNEDIAAILPIGFSSIGEITIWTAASDCDRARKILIEKN